MMFTIISRTNKRLSKRARIGIAFFSILAVALGIGVMWFGSAVFNAKGKIITNNNGLRSVLFQKKSEDVKPTELSGEGDGRINVLLIGIDNAAGLADVLQVLSIDTQNKKASLLSIPRDLWVKIPGYGYNKINASHSLAERTKKGSGPDVAMATVSDLLDLPLHYYARVNFQGLQQIVDAVGGITVNAVQLDDYEFPNNNFGYLPAVHIKAGQQQFDGKTALIYARSRHAINPGEGSDFARSKRQQQVMFGIKEKAMSLGFLSNPLKLNQALTAVGNNLQTNLQVSEIQQLIKLFQDINTTQIITKVLDTEANGPLVGGQQDERGYIITPRDGDYSYKEVKRIAHEIFTDPYLAKEKSTIEIQNATTKNGLGTTVSSLLKSYGYNVVKVGNSTSKEQYTQLIDYSGGARPFTQNFLEKRFGLKSRRGTKTDGVTTDFVLILGSDYDTSAKVTK